MVTWLRKLKYSIGMKSIAFVLLCMAGILFINSFVGMMDLPYDESYYESYGFQNDIVETAGYVRDWIVRYSDDSIFDPEKITENDIKAYSGEQDPKVGIINARKTYYSEIQRTLDRKVADFDYLAIDYKAGKAISNMKTFTGDNQEQLKAELLSRNVYLIGNGFNAGIGTATEGLSMNSKYSTYYAGDAFDGQDDYEIIVAVAEGNRLGNQHDERQKEFEIRKTTEKAIYTGFLAAIVMALIGGLYWISVVGRKASDQSIHMKSIDRISLEIQIVIYSGLMFLWLLMAGAWGSNLIYEGWIPYSSHNALLYTGEKVLWLIIALGVGITVFFASSFIRHIKNHSMRQYSLILKTFSWLGKNLLQEKTLSIGAVVAMITYVIVNGLLVILTLAFLPAIVILLAFNGVVLVGMLKIISDYNKLSKGIETIVGGNLSAKIELRQALPIMKQTADSINNVGEGLKQAVERTIKSERFKTELITNVSHDLKTPLTSIISYIDLLKDESIENEAAKEYIQVLDERSNRLKQLVEDLVEASKAATGNVKIDLQVLELQQLVLQEIGEYADRLEDQGLQVISKVEESVKVLGDGRHVWRIVENLLSNVCKYALGGTRVYVEVTQDKTYGKLIIKNISKEQLAMSPSELTERFVRGDEARSTEGSGLGLAIAQSLVDVQGGHLKIEIDGDLFKVEIWMPLA